ncbi:MAG: ATP-binding protein [Pseudomonadota bacterium]
MSFSLRGALRTVERVATGRHGNLVFSRTDLVYHLEDWLASTRGKLLITGYTGSGKTLLAHQLAARCGVRVLCLDVTDSEAEELALARRHGPQVFRQLYTRLASRRLRSALQQADKLVIEGASIVLHDEPDTLRAHAILMPGLSALRSFARAYERNRFIDGSSARASLIEVLDNALLPEVGAMMDRVRRWQRQAGVGATFRRDPGREA